MNIEIHDCRKTNGVPSGIFERVRGQKERHKSILIHSKYIVTFCEKVGVKSTQTRALFRQLAYKYA